MRNRRKSLQHKGLRQFRPGKIVVSPYVVRVYVDYIRGVGGMAPPVCRGLDWVVHPPPNSGSIYLYTTTKGVVIMPLVDSVLP